MDFNKTVFQKITDFVQDIGIPFGYHHISEQNFLTGLLIESGMIERVTNTQQNNSKSYPKMLIRMRTSFRL